MFMDIVLAVFLTVGIFALSVKRLNGFKITTKSLSRIGIVAAISIVLYMIKLVPFPQGGGFSLLSILPIMILASVFGIEEALLCAIVIGGLKGILQPPFHPLQLPLDYFGSMMAIAFTPMFGIEKKQNIVLGGILAGLLSILFSVLSGVIFFGSFAPDGMNTWVYSIGYNFLGYGIEVALSIVVLSIIKMQSLKQILKG